MEILAYDMSGHISCNRYHARLSHQSCHGYRKRNPDACKGCDHQPKPYNGQWTKAKLLEVLKDYSVSRNNRVSLNEFKDLTGINFYTLKQLWSSWQALCAAAGVHMGQDGRRKKPRLILDFARRQDLLSALEEQAEQMGRTPEEQAMAILKGWLE